MIDIKQINEDPQEFEDVNVDIHKEYNYLVMKYAQLLGEYLNLLKDYNNTVKEKADLENKLLYYREKVTNDLTRCRFTSD